MKMRIFKQYMVYVLLILAAKTLIGCGDMPHSNPLDPKNPNYTPPPLPNFTSIAIQGDKTWFGSAGGGLVSFDGYKWSIYTKSEGLPDNYIEAVAAQGDNIWFTVIGRSQKIYNFNGQNVKEYSIPSIVSVSADENHIWIGSQNEIGTYDPVKDSYIWYQLPEGGQVVDLFWDGDFVWVAIQRLVDRIQSVEVAKFNSQDIEWQNKGYFLPLFNDEILLAIALDRDNIWYSTSRGDIKQFVMLNDKALNRTQIGISPRGEGCIAADEGLVWFSYGSRGLIRYHKITGMRESFFEGEIVYGIAITNECIWAVTNATAHCYDKQSGMWKDFSYPKFDVKEDGKTTSL